MKKGDGMVRDKRCVVVPTGFLEKGMVDSGIRGSNCLVGFLETDDIRETVVMT
jgi:hypothetical protein